MSRRGERDAIRAFIIQEVQAHPVDIGRVVSERFGISRQAAHYHLKQLVGKGVLKREGRTRNIRYELLAFEKHAAFPVSKQTEEHQIWQEFAEPFLSGLRKNVLDICHYGFTEIVNNVVDHSESPRMLLTLKKSPDSVEIQVRDIGIGIFRKIQEELNLEHQREAVFELSKGKLTTDELHHTGEGVFFTSRVFDKFSILSGELFLTHRRDQEDWLIEDRHDPMKGTSVSMQIAPTSKQTLQEVFDYYAVPQDDYAFSRTRVVIKLAEQASGPLVSRSQAKRVLGRLSKFKEVLFDFTGIDAIGPAFADEIFRVYRTLHPGVALVPLQMNNQVRRMVERAVRHTPLSDDEPR
ncbi:MAG: DUF4325 domain-containing protein [Luteitalea sp.]|nr:DUF4325 domain-containing protein [Luteitalea sp.]